MQTASDPGPSTGECKTDDDCNGNICARDHWCHPARAIISIKTTWTVRGMTADAFTCQSSPDLEITFTGPNGEWALGYAPVPCADGQFLMDKLPGSYTNVELGLPDHDAASKPILNGQVAFDLQF
jgi:hypothetical protein